MPDVATGALGAGQAAARRWGRQHRFDGVETDLATDLLDVVVRVGQIGTPGGWGDLDALAARRDRGPDPLDQGDGPLGGHALGNLLIVALWELHDDPVAGLDLVARLLQAQGRVLPMAAVPLTIEADVTGLDPDDPGLRAQAEQALEGVRRSMGV